MSTVKKEIKITKLRNAKLSWFDADFISDLKKKSQMKLVKKLKNLLRNKAK